MAQFLNAGVSINVEDKRSGKSKKFKNNGGLSSYVKYLKGRKQVISDIFECSAKESDVGIEIAMQWADSYSENVLCYTNNIPQGDGGTHLAGFRRALTRTLKSYAEKSGMLEKEKVLVEQNDFKNAENLIKQGYQVIFFKNLNNDIVSYAKSVNCKYIFKNKKLTRVYS